MKIATLIENDGSDTSPDLTSEWGLSLHVQFGDLSLLFDTGKSGAFADNAKHLDVDVRAVDAAVLSHHHFDHGGGLERFFELNPTAPLYLGEEPYGVCRAKVFKFFGKHIGLDPSILSRHPDRFVFVKDPTEILPDVFVIPHILDERPKPLGNRRLYVKTGGKMVHDDFHHEIVLAIRDHDGMVIFTGCSHSGILNMVDTVSRRFEGVPIKAVIGGFHLISSPLSDAIAGSQQEVETLGRTVLAYPVALTYTGHCTGAKGFGILKSVMGDRLASIRTGSVFEV